MNCQVAPFGGFVLVLGLCVGCLAAAGNENAAVGDRAAGAGKLWEEFPRLKAMMETGLYDGSHLHLKMQDTLAQVIRQHPGGLDEARARLLAANMLDPSRSAQSNVVQMLARHNRVLARRILKQLIATAPQTPGLLKVAGDEASEPYGRCPHEFVLLVADYLADRVQKRQADEAEARYRLAWLTPRLARVNKENDKVALERRNQMFEDLARDFPETPWGQEAERRTMSSIAYADKHAGTRHAARALWSAGIGHGSSSGGNQGGPMNAERLEKAMECYLRAVQIDPEVGELFDASISYYQYGPRERTSIHVSDVSGDTKRLEELVKEYLALRPLDNFYLVSQLPKARGFDKPTDDYYAFLGALWDDVEARAKPELRETVLFARARFFGRYIANRHPLGDAAFERALNEYPRGKYAPFALEALARNAEADGKPELADSHWQRLLDDFPEHDLAPIAALQQAILRMEGDTAAAREALSDALERYPHDPYLRQSVALKIRETYWKDKNREQAALAKEQADSALDHLREVRPTRFPEAVLAHVQPQERDPAADVLKEKRFPTPEEQIAFLNDLWEKFPESRQLHWSFDSALQLLVKQGKHDAARAAGAQFANRRELNPYLRLRVRLLLLRLDYLHPADKANPLTAKAARLRLNAALEDYSRDDAETVAQHELTDRLRPLFQEHAPRVLTEALALEFRDRRGAQGLPEGLFDKWFVLSAGRGPLPVCFWDGTFEIIDLSSVRPTLRRGLWIHRDNLARDLGVGQADATRFVEEVVNQEFCLDAKSQPLALNCSPVFGQLCYYDEARTQLSCVGRKANRDPCIGPPTHFFHRQPDGTWQKLDGAAWSKLIE